MKHYRIVCDQAGTGRYYIAEAKKFATLQELVYFYESKLKRDMSDDEFVGHADGLCSRLIAPAPRLLPTPGLSPIIERNYEVPRQHVQLLNVLGKGHFGEVRQGKCYI